MSAHISLQARIDDYLAERHRLGFQLHSRDTFLTGFASFVASRDHRGPLTIELIVDWIKQGKGGCVAILAPYFCHIMRMHFALF